MVDRVHLVRRALDSRKRHRSSGCIGTRRRPRRCCTWDELRLCGIAIGDCRRQHRIVLYGLDQSRRTRIILLHGAVRPECE